jgi:small subunit ribosomal protein S1
MSWTKRVQHPSEVLRKSDDVDVLVLGVDPENKRISLGLKQTTDDPWDDIAQRFQPGVESAGRVVRLMDDGAVVDLGDDIEGFVPRSQLGVPDGEDAASYVLEGDEMQLRVIEFDAPNRRIVMTNTGTPEKREAPAQPPSSVEEPPSDDEAAAQATTAQEPPPGEEAADSGAGAGEADDSSSAIGAREAGTADAVGSEVEPA